ncbi:hypothetical protein PPACK8108_LOCUS3460 [Phakopsora pachyrhizi]|uniref:Uncharacterized protein n=1 Tax=Phakopsora pachyrhizi TaxID=170000 RepID=A0AAV0AK29_PHAPC|nr:hypothetical protein PPACK8108_LOCUS3460 [Phakopsora pachyrhizi]
MNLLTSGSRSETLESEANSSQHQSIISQFKQTHSEDYHQNQLLQLPPLSFQRYYYSTIPFSSLYSSEPNYDSSQTLLLPLLVLIGQQAERLNRFRVLRLGEGCWEWACCCPNLAGGIIVDVIVSKNGKTCQTRVTTGKLTKLDEEDDRIEEHFLRSNCSLSSKKSKSEPIRLTRLFGLLLEDEEEEQQPEGFLIGFPFLVN